MKNTTDLLIESVNEQPVAVAETFDELMKAKVLDILEQKKVEIASSMFTEQVETPDPEDEDEEETEEDNEEELEDYEDDDEEAGE